MRVAISALLLASTVSTTLLAQDAPPPLPEPVPPPLPAPEPTPPPLPPPQPQIQIFIEQGGQPVGPLSLDQVLQQIQAGTITRNTLVWKPGAPEWLKAENLAELRDAFGALPPTIPESAKLNEFMVGTWEASIPSMQGVITTLQVQYRADGTYSGVQTIAMQGVGQSATPMAGKWTTQSAGQGQIALIVTPAPDPQFGGTYAPQQTVVLKIIDDNTLYEQSQGYYAKRIAR